VATTLVPICLLVGALAVHELDGEAPTLLTRRFAIRLGEWSFCLYLVHQFLLATAVAVLVPKIGTSVWSYAAADVVAFVVSLVAAAALHHLVERPFERRLRGRGPRPVVSASRRSDRGS
jgi:peptidoglycan/LPS O-acetylase OafA/YrhL